MNLKKTFKMLFTFLCLAFVGVALASCGGGNSGDKPDKPGVDDDPKEYTYNTFTSVSPSNWNELTYEDNNDTQIMSYLGSAFFEYNFQFDENGNVKEDGSFEIEYSAATKLQDVTAKYAGQYGLPEDATKLRAYQITLRQDLKWQNGDPINAHDFVYTMQQQLDPLFKNYRADSFYVGATIIHNAQGYAKQGESGWFAADATYSVYSEDLDEQIFFSLKGAEEEGSTGAKSYIRSWLESQLGTSQFTAAQAASVLIGNFLPSLTVEQFASIEGKSLAEIKADEALKAVWDAVIGWWQTEPNEELQFFVAHYTYPEMDWSEVGMFVGETDYDIVIVLDKDLVLLAEDGESLGFKAAYNMSSLPLVHKATYEACKIAPTVEGELWRSNYNSSALTTMSWGPYKLESFQAGKEYQLVKNDQWFGYNDPQYKDQYQTTRIVCETIKEWQTAWVKFQAGEIDGIGIDVSIADDYKNSPRAYFTPDDFVASLQIQSDVEALRARETEGVNKTILKYDAFRKALSLAINRADFAAKTTTSSLAGLGLFNSMHYYDAEHGLAYRSSEAAKKVLCDVYSVNIDEFATLDDAVDSITGYDLAVARQLVNEAYDQAIADGEIEPTDIVKIQFGSGAINEVVTRRHDYVKAAWKELVKGTKLEGRLDFEEDKDAGSAWATDFRAGVYDICMGGWSGAAWDPGYFLLAYLSPDYMYSTAWDTSAEMLTFRMEGVPSVDAEGNPLSYTEDTLSLMDWYDCLNGASGSKYNWASGHLSEELRLQLIAALEKAVLSKFYSVPLYNSFGASLISFKLDYITYEYNTFMGYGGIRYATYNYTDAQWEAFVAEHNGQLDYK